MRHVFGVAKLRARNVNKTPDVVIGFAGGGIAWVDHGKTINVEVVAIRARVDRPNGDFPNAVGAFSHFGPAAVARDIAGTEAHRLGVGGEDTKSDPAVREHFRRDDLWTLRPAVARAFRSGLGENARDENPCYKCKSE